MSDGMKAGYMTLGMPSTPQMQRPPHGYEAVSGMKPRLDDFLASETLDLLAESPIEAEKDENFKSMAWCLTGFLSLVSGCFIPIVMPSICCIESIFEQSYLRLTDNSVEFSQPLPNLCALAQTKRTVKLDKITDVTIEDDCAMQCFGLKKVIVQTAGTGGVGAGANLSGVQAMFLKEPEKWKDAINHAQTIYNAPEAQCMAAVSATTKSMEGRVSRLSLLMKLNLFKRYQDEDFNDISSSFRVSTSGLLLHETDYTSKLLALASLRDSGKIQPQLLEDAVSNVHNIIMATTK